MREAATERSSRFRPPKSCKEEVSFLERSKPKSTQCKGKWAVDALRNWQAAREKNKVTSPLLRRAVCSKIIMFTMCKLLTVLKKDLRPGQPFPKCLAPVVQRLDNAIHRINHYPADSVVCSVNIYPLDSNYPLNSVIQPLSNQGLAYKSRPGSC